MFPTTRWNDYWHLRPATPVPAFSIAAFGVMAAVRVKQMQSFMGLMQMVMMPMFFISGALFPVANLPGWLAFLNRIDPIPTP